jgi:hypothetical protein
MAAVVGGIFANKKANRQAAAPAKQDPLPKQTDQEAPGSAGSTKKRRLVGATGRSQLVSGRGEGTTRGGLSIIQ